MTRRLGLMVAALVALACGVAIGAQERGDTATAATAERPNIVVLETDDQTLAEMAVLPNVKRLIGDEGVSFDQNFDSFSLCCPSRATFLTGQYPHNDGVRGNAPPDGGFEKLDGTRTLPVWLQASGYYTAHLGKYLNGYGRRNPLEIPPGWSEWRGAVDPSTYRYYGYTLNENGALTTYCAVPEPSCYQTDVLRDKANEIIRRRTPEGPFFLWVAFLANHSGGPREPGDPAGFATPDPAPRYANKLAGTPLPQPPSFNEADVSDKPLIIRRRPLITARQRANIQENWQQRRETLMAVDDAVVSIVDTLRATGELDNTLIVFTSDNGFFHGEHRVRNGKVLLYEESIHLPLADALDRQHVAAARRTPAAARVEHRRRGDDPRRGGRATVRAHPRRHVAPPALAGPAARARARPAGGQHARRHALRRRPLAQLHVRGAPERRP